MTVALDTHVATRENIDAVVATLRSVCGGLWLVMDRSTHCHWVIEASTIQAARGYRYSRDIANTGLATICSRAGVPVFAIESHDSLTWTLPGETLLVQEGRFRGSAIFLQRLDDFDAPKISDESLERRQRNGERCPTIRTGDGWLIEVAECLLPTGDIEVDTELKDIAVTLEEHMYGPEQPRDTLAVLDKLDRRLYTLASRPEMNSFIWYASLREMIQRIQRSVPAA